jgi:hypothetical protein
MHRAEPTTEEEPSEVTRWARLVQWALEISGLSREKPTELSADLVRFGHQLRESGRKTVAFAAATPDAPTTRVCHELAIALGRMTSSPVGWIDVGALFVDAVRDLSGEGAIEDDGVFRTAMVGGARWIAPLRPGLEGTRFQLVELLIAHARATIVPPLEYLFIDLAGFQRTGELLGTLEQMDGVVIVARSDYTARGDLVRLYRDIPERLNLGVLLTR